MELWIRSQDKQKLIKVNELNILGYANFVIIRGCNNQETSFWLGNYKTKERALEVLDEIEGTLMFERLKKITGNAFIQVKNGVAIYEMPEE